MSRLRAPGRGTAAVVALVAVVMVGGLAVSSLRGRQDPGGPAAGPAAGPSSASPSSARRYGGPTIDMGPVTDPGDVSGCLAEDFATDPAQVTVVYGERQRTRTGSSPVLVLRNEAGAIRLCDMFGGDYPAQLPLPHASATTPVAYFSTGRREWSCAESTHRLQLFQVSAWLSVNDTVDAVRLRFVVDGTPGPWFATSAANGLAHLQAWLADPQPPSARIVLQQQALDADGATIASVLPAAQVLPGCETGSAQIG